MKESNMLLLEAIGDALTFIESKAKENLQVGVYNKSKVRSEPLTYDLYNDWFKKVEAIGIDVIGVLSNTSGHALYLEFGTDNEGTGEHYIPVSSDGELHWIDPVSGRELFSDEGHFVRGITPLYFLTRAVSEHETEIAKIFYDKFRSYFSRGSTLSDNGQTKLFDVPQAAREWQGPGPVRAGDLNG